MLPTSHIQIQEPVHEIPQVEEPDNPPVEEPDNPPVEVPNINVPVCDAVQNDEQPEAVEIENEPAASKPRSTTKKMLEPTRHSRRIENQKLGVSLMSLEQYSDDPDEPTNYNDALSSQDGILWKKAVDEDLSYPSDDVRQHMFALWESHRNENTEFLAETEVIKCVPCFIPQHFAAAERLFSCLKSPVTSRLLPA
ncbi:hypothetical protein DAPPUDRAFT_316064 [Daphnia pulex]|uniref:Uncharacterized protein n=1 Tax=Daphnia pulex TaxID=6669 RepID=E9GBL7_DAPPU|nr:hypothetical protein DAPPUDRAFT_316064 [Daphnia pulex]|eukprot:EFX83132.1 hypothetical protein DAPPUDRAFT_316064 [Daphnia pulex]